ncbi:CheR family methyltransferase [Ferrigenium sp. UT5]|uniref:CheR family methyltransferase n=1 Tax=Ferrigenium sp. UT5 TaxID=3242105 RepID=UPI003553C72E
MHREFVFTEQDFQRIRTLIHQHAGIALADSKQELVYSRLARRLRATWLKSFGEYLALLQRGGETEWEAFTNSLTTNLTSFFREAHHFALLAEHLRKLDKSGPIQLWCSACSTGEEAYSMAITVAETFGGFKQPVSIIASDLDSSVIATARAGRYKAEAVARLSLERIERFFTPADAGYFMVRPELQRMIEFKRFNLLDAAYPIRAKLDAIFCRNVMIYFDKETQLAILKKFAPLLKPNGLLFAGHSEHFYQAAAYFRLRGQTVYALANRLETIER